MAFTLERYIATCRPFLAQKLCTVERSRKIIAGCWVLGFLYCSPWLGLAQVLEDEIFAGSYHCQLTLTQSLYTGLFTTDLVLLYVVPLIQAMFVYWNIGRVLRSLPDELGPVSMIHQGLEMENSMKPYPSSNRKFVRKPRSTPEHHLSRNESFADRDHGATLVTSATRTLSERNGQPSPQIIHSVTPRGRPNTRRNVAQA
ncbi:hypothetical protein RvY_14150 [Ramazzottius varieornatus]|uniref:Thyrotropin-releasing hormone receptor n=1 Tax=Ramazzottius varieornatus TaxID=947166 RepID=A0A1D1VQE1_RAMVA|nr:hypothetical protein RvY_14150 [Ramazzottius varieornatus]